VWHVELHQGSADEFHQRALPQPTNPTAWWFTPERSALILGSAQPATHIDEQACAQADIEIIRRRSGGGAVLVDPDNTYWVDLIIPTSHSLWRADVSSSAWWLGEVWLHTLTSLGSTGLSVHRGPMLNTPWSRHVCFAGVGGGEVVTATGSKIVGISQRRTRDGARFQCALYRQWQPQLLASLFRDPAPSADDLSGVAATVAYDDIELRDAFLAHLPNE
jgi:lipoate---protein ligase